MFKNIPHKAATVVVSIIFGVVIAIVLITFLDQLYPTLFTW